MPAPCRGWSRTLARLAAWPLVSGQSASGGSMSRVAEGHFRRKREALLILRGSTSRFRGHPRVLTVTTSLSRPRRRGPGAHRQIREGGRCAGRLGHPDGQRLAKRPPDPPAHPRLLARPGRNLLPRRQRTALTPNDFTTLGQIRGRLAAFQTRCNAVARPFNWRFARADLDDLTPPDRRPRKDRATRPGSMISSPAETYGRDHLASVSALARLSCGLHWSVPVPGSARRDCRPERPAQRKA
jgi:hypothetical protein